MVMHEMDPVLFPKPIFIRFNVLILHMTHVDIHEGCSGKEVSAFGRNDGNLVIRQFANMPGGCNARNSVADDDDAHEEKIAGRILRNNFRESPLLKERI